MAEPVDEIPLGGRKFNKTDAERYAENIRLECLKAAVTGSGGNYNDATVVRRAAVFEDYVRQGLQARGGETGAFSGDHFR